MSLKARRDSDGAKVFSHFMMEAGGVPPRSGYSCVECGEPLTLRRGQQVVWHFAHQPSSTCPLKYTVESPRHLAGKYFIWKGRAGILERLGIRSDVDFEVWVPSVKRRIDVEFRLSNGDMEAHEIQVSHITLDELESRRNAYEGAGYEFFVHFSEQAAKTRDVQIWIGDKMHRGGVLVFEAEHQVDSIWGPESEEPTEEARAAFASMRTR